MGKSKFVFDNETGTLKAVDVSSTSSQTTLPILSEEQAEEKKLDLGTHKPNIATNESVIQFRENSDYSIVQVVDERTRKPMMIIGGYALDIKFNMAALRSTEKIEQLLGGLTSMFRKMILEQALNKSEG